MSRRTFILAHEPARQGALQAVREAPDGYVIHVQELALGRLNSGAGCGKIPSNYDFVIRANYR